MRNFRLIDRLVKKKAIHIMKKVLPFLAILIGLLIAYYFITNKDRATSLKSSLTEFAIADTAAINRIFIADNKGHKVDLIRTDTGWVVNDKFLAKRDAIGVLLKTFKLAYIKSPVPKSAQETVIRVMSSTSKRVEIFTGGEEPEKIWHVGHATPDHFGTYMILETPEDGRSAEPFILSIQGFAGHLYSRFFADDRDWRRSEIFSYHPQEISRVRIEYPDEPERGFELHYDGDRQFDLNSLIGLDIQGYDTIAAKDLLVNLQKVNYEMHAKGVNAVQADSVLKTAPLSIIEIEDRNGSINKVKVFYKLAQPDELDDEGNPLMNDIERKLALLPSNEFVIVQSFDFDRISVDLSFFAPDLSAEGMP